MKVPVCGSNFTAFARRASRLTAVLAGLTYLHANSAFAGLSFVIGTPTTVGSVRFSSVPDSVTITAGLTAPGTITSGLSIPANRIQYDIINSDQGIMYTWTVHYAPAVGPSIIGAYTPLGYLTTGGTITPQGGMAYTTLFNAGYGPYNYNTGAPWIIDYEPDHITFTTAASPPGLPANDGEGELNPTPYLPSFAILFNPDLTDGLIPADATVGSADLTGQVLGPLPGNPCLSIQCSNLVLQTCSNCFLVTASTYSATAIDTCCTNVVLQYQPPVGTCLPLDSTNIVVVTAHDSCGNAATNFFKVAVVPGPNCLPTNCISINASNLTVYTCNPCTPVAYNVTAKDNCCPGAAPALVFNPPVTACFPLNSTTPVTVTASDQCGNTNTATFTVTVLPGPTCGNTNCISIYSSNIVAYTCSNCTTVPFTAFAFDQCCAAGVTLFYYPPTNTCFPQNTTTPVEIVAKDVCGNSATNYITVTVLPGSNCNSNPCISIYASNVVADTCSNCMTVSYNAYAVDNCCAGAAPGLVFNPPVTTCFPQNTTTPVTVTAIDQCGNSNTATFTVTVLPASGCTTNCISLYASNIVAYTCSNCTTVSYNAYAIDNCCPISSAALSFNPPATTCFPQNTTTPVTVTASDPCGNSSTATFTVTVLPAAGCGPTNCLSLYTSNIVVYTCSNCTTVPFKAVAVDPCCTVATVQYHPSTNTCFPLNSTTPVEVVAKDSCGDSVTNFIIVTVLPGPNCGGSNPGPSVTGQGSPGGSGTNYMAVWWPGTNGQLQGSLDLNHWAPLPGATNSPYVVPTWLPNSFYRLQYR